MRTLKKEEVDGRNYRDQEEARASIGQFIDDIYNGQRLHSALNYLPPSVFEARLSALPPGASAGPPTGIVPTTVVPSGFVDNARKGVVHNPTGATTTEANLIR